MKTQLKRISGLAIFASLLINPAFLASAVASPYGDCTCIARQVAGQAVANLSKPVGNVLYSGAKGYMRVSKPAGLNVGSIVSVSGASSARITSGPGCDISVAANSVVSVSMPGGPSGLVCIKVTELTRAGFNPFVSSEATGSVFSAAGLYGSAGASSIGLGASLVSGVFLLGAGGAVISK